MNRDNLRFRRRFQIVLCASLTILVTIISSAVLTWNEYRGIEHISGYGFGVMSLTDPTAYLERRNRGVGICGGDIHFYAWRFYGYRVLGRYGQEVPKDIQVKNRWEPTSCSATSPPYPLVPSFAGFHCGKVSKQNLEGHWIGYDWLYNYDCTVLAFPAWILAVPFALTAAWSVRRLRLLTRLSPGFPLNDGIDSIEEHQTIETSRLNVVAGRVGQQSLWPYAVLVLVVIFIPALIVWGIRVLNP